MAPRRRSANNGREQVQQHNAPLLNHSVGTAKQREREVRPNVLAVLRLMTSSTFTNCWTSPTSCSNSAKRCVPASAGRHSSKTNVSEPPGASRQVPAGVERGVEASSTRHEVHITQRELGSVIGMSRETTNKQLRAWEARGWLRLKRGSVAVVNTAALMKLLS